MKKVIAHIDMNCFYASVEEKYNPILKNKPLAISGSISKRQGIIVTSNYPARNLGIKTTMRVGDARKLCPTLKVIKTDFVKYQEESKKIFSLIKSYTEKIEIVSVDEAYIDLSEFKEPVKVIASIQKRIYKELDIPSSVGVSYNKFFAKMASGLRKPLGFSIINKNNFKEILWNLDVEKMHGCGGSSAKKLKKFNIFTIKDLANANEVILHSLLGVQGLRLKNFANGLDNRNLKLKVDRKSIGHSKTFSEDLYDEDEIFKAIKNLTNKVCTRAKNRNYIGNNISINIKFNDFKTVVRSKKIISYINDEYIIFDTAWDLIINNYNFDKGVRLLGVSLNNIIKKEDLKEQLDIFKQNEYKKEEIRKKTIEKLNKKYCKEVIYSVDNKKLKKNIITTSFSKDFLDELD